MSVESIGQNTGTSLGTALTVSGTNTKGSWVQLSASTSSACTGICAFMLGGAADGTLLVDIGTGGAGAETVIVSNVSMIASGTTWNPFSYFFFPKAIPSGTRVAMRFQSTSASSTMEVGLYLLNNSGSILIDSCTPTTYGANTGTSLGTAVDAGASTNTKGSYAQITASTTDDIDWLTIHIDWQNNTAMQVARFLVDIATGAAASETVVINNILVSSHSGLAGKNPTPFFGPFPVTVASGTRLAARCQSTTNDATDRIIGISLIGWNGSAAAGGGGASFSAHIA